jgi:hypothetical protein
MADITVQKLGGSTPELQLVGGTPRAVFTPFNASAAVAAAAGGDQFLNDGRTWFEVVNGSAGTREVRFLRQNPSSGGEKYDATFLIPVGTRQCGPFPVNEFNDVNGKVQVRYDSVTNVSVRAFRITEKLSA